jgi:hypothetical protein
MKNKLNKLKQTHGKEETQNKPKTLDQIWGDDGLSKYKTNDVEAYTARLKEMNKSDLQAHAVKIGLIPIDDRNMLVQRLIREFKRHVASYRSPDIKAETQASKENHISKTALDILREGR